MIELFGTSIQGLLEVVGINGPVAVALERLVILGVIVVLALLANWVARRLIVRFLHAMFRRSRMHWDDVIADRGDNNHSRPKPGWHSRWPRSAECGSPPDLP